MFKVVISLQAFLILATTSAARKLRRSKNFYSSHASNSSECSRYDKLSHVALLEHNRRRSDLALGKTKTRTSRRNMWSASFMMELKENCWLTNRIRAQPTCSRDIFDRSIPGMRNTYMTKAYSEVDALRKAITAWWNEVKTHPRPESLKTEDYLATHKQFLPMALSYQEHVSCAVSYCDKRKKKRRTKRKYFAQCFYTAAPNRNQNLYEKGPPCSGLCYTDRGEKCSKGLCYVTDYQSNSIH